MERAVSSSDLSIQGFSNVHDNTDAILSTSTSTPFITFIDNQEKDEKSVNEFDFHALKRRLTLPIPKRNYSKLSENSKKWIEGSTELTEDSKKSIDGSKESTEDFKKLTEDSKKSIDGSKESTEDFKKLTEDSKKSIDGSKESTEDSKKLTENSKKSTPTNSMLSTPINKQELEEAWVPSDLNVCPVSYGSKNNDNDYQQVISPKHSPKLRNNHNNCQQVISLKHALKMKAKHFCTCSNILQILFLPMLLSILVIIISVYLCGIQDRQHSCDFAIAVIELKKRIHGQDQAVHALCNYLQLDTLPSKVIVLVGGTGVGKSYTVEIIKKNFPRQYAIRQYSPIEALTEINIPLLYPNLIILENLRKHDLTNVVNFLKERRDEMRNQYVTVLAVLNVEEINVFAKRSIDLKQNLNTIKRSFAESNIDAEIIPYDSLSEDALLICIIEAILDSGVMLTYRQIASLKLNLVRTKAGCKGAYNKVQLIGRHNKK